VIIIIRKVISRMRSGIATQQ